jgi:hypothetical protein
VATILFGLLFVAIAGELGDASFSLWVTECMNLLASCGFLLNCGECPHCCSITIVPVSFAFGFAFEILLQIDSVGESEAKLFHLGKGKGGHIQGLNFFFFRKERLDSFFCACVPHCMQISHLGFYFHRVTIGEHLCIYKVLLFWVSLLLVALLMGLVCCSKAAWLLWQIVYKHG